MRILVVEDEAIVAQRLTRMLQSILAERPVSVRHYEDFYDAVAHVREHPVDLLFLDLNLNGKDGFRILSEAAAGAFQTIVVSGHTDQAIRAYEYGVLDFVPKPFNEDRLRKALERYQDPGSTPATKFLAIRKGTRIHPIPVAQIVYIKGADDYSEIHCLDGSTELHEKTLTALEHVLPDSFVRVHRSFVVNLAFVSAMENQSGSRYALALTSGEILPVSRAKVSALRSQLDISRGGR